MQIPILNGIYTDGDPDYRHSYPVNMVPVPIKNGISSGYLKPAEGIVQFGTAPGIDRGGFNWNGKCYRVMGKYLVRIDSDGSSTTIGEVGNDFKNATMVNSFDRLAIASNDNLFYYDETNGLSQVTDPDLGVVLDVVWVDGYFMTTDGEFLVVTELTDPTQVNPFKYGSSEAAPDPVVALLKLKNEVYAINRHTIEVFDNVGASGFPFARIETAQIERGAVGTHACAVFLETIAFVGSGENESIGVWMASNSSSIKISTREIDKTLQNYTEEQLSDIVVEVRVDKGHEFLYIHLPDKTVVFDGMTTNALGQPVWFNLTSSVFGDGIYKARNFVWCYDKWLCGNPSLAVHGYLTDSVSSHYGNTVRWEFGTPIVYNESLGVIFHSIELVALTGNIELGENPIISTSYSLDGRTWSADKPIEAGKIGDRTKRLVWLQQGNMQNIRMQRFQGTSDAKISFARLEAKVEPLYA